MNAGERLTPSERRFIETLVRLIVRRRRKQSAAPDRQKLPTERPAA
jgi:hypothetical protein